jgi:hypothetical protein
MHRTVAVCGIEPNLDPHGVAHFGIRGAADITVQIQIEVALSDRHGAYVHIRIAIEYFDRRDKEKLGHRSTLEQSRGELADVDRALVLVTHEPRTADDACPPRLRRLKRVSRFHQAALEL